jgi:hypothetical protein
MKRVRYTNENITETLKSSELLSGSYFFATVQADYSLSATEYMMLKNGWVSIYSWALNVGFATFGYALSVLPKLLSGADAYKFTALSGGEWSTLGVGVGLVVLLCGIGFFLPNDRKEAMKAIKEHFKKAPKSRQQVRG